MSDLYLGSIDLNKINKDDIVTKDKDGNTFQNGAKYLNIAIWINPEATEDWKQLSIKTGKKEESYYIGNAKKYQNNNNQPATQQELVDEEEDNPLPF
jgi:hypothetical protein